MNDFTEFTQQFRKPYYPVIIDIEGKLVAARSPKMLIDRLLRTDIALSTHYDAIDKTGETWTLFLVDNHAVLSPLTLRRELTKLELIRWFNGRKNKPENEAGYSEKSLSSKRRDRIIAEIAELLVDANEL